MGHTGRAALFSACMALVACGGEDFIELTPGGEPRRTAPAATEMTVEVWAGGLTQHTLSARVGDRITFINVDDAAHQIGSDPQALRRHCPEFDGPALQPGDAFTVVVATAGRRCQLHDLLNPEDSGFASVITVAGTAEPSGQAELPALDDLQALEDLARDLPLDL